MAAQTATVAPHEVKRLDKALDALAGQYSGAGSVSSILVGGGLIAGGAYLTLHDTRDDGGDDLDLPQYFHGAGAGMLIGTGGALLVASILNWDRESIDAHRLARFRAADARGAMEVSTFARFEGDFLAQRALARSSREAGGRVAIGFAIGGGGALALAIGATKVDDDIRFGLGAIGTSWLIYGLWQGLVLLNSESEVEKLVREYVEDRQRVRKLRRARVALLPAASRDGVGLTLHAQL